MSRRRLFRCAECGGDVVSATGRGRLSEYRPGVELPVPDDFAIPTCKACGETYFTVERGEQLAKLQAPSFDAWLEAHAVELIEILRARHQTTLRHLETACGVTPTYFSHLLAKRRTPSLTLVRLLEAFEASPAELRRHLEGRAWQPATVRQGTLHKLAR